MFERFVKLGTLPGAARSSLLINVLWITTGFDQLLNLVLQILIVSRNTGISNVHERKSFTNVVSHRNRFMQLSPPAVKQTFLRFHRQPFVKPLGRFLDAFGGSRGEAALCDFSREKFRSRRMSVASLPADRERVYACNSAIQTGWLGRVHGDRHSHNEV